MLVSEGRWNPQVAVPDSFSTSINAPYALGRESLSHYVSINQP